MKLINNIKTFWTNVSSEMKKVTWPSRKQSWESMIIVIVVTGLITIFVGLSDFIFIKLMDLIYSI